MRLITFFTIIKAIKSLGEVSNYVGETVILPSGADPSWNLSKVEWSILSNNTWIATYLNGKISTERFYRYKGRLTLNISSGDLTIHNLSKNDAMEYSVDLKNTEGQDRVNKIQLRVRQRPQKPTLQTITATSKEGRCWVVLRCSSTDEGVYFTWQVAPRSVAVINSSNPDGNAAVLLALFNASQSPIEFTCTSNRAMDHTSSVLTPKCDDDKPQPTWRPSSQPEPGSRSRYVGVFVGGFLLGLSLTLIFIFKEKIQAVWEYVKAKLCPSNPDVDLKEVQRQA